jgi:hypothetical protein
MRVVNNITWGSAMDETSAVQVDGNTRLTARDAYLAMFDYLTNRWEAKSRPEFLASLLGDVDPTQFKVDNLPGDELPTADPATWDDWMDSVRRVLSSGSSEASQ